ncbi:tRNA uridine-5-carboxymethylaminomethyl(34) synthesis GTPase MnmE [Croceicoccus sp. F390]|uniref:tRNA modification GTPase MnmE n=1 Tax=Croceicoccus esteveae TaxID=3075597 RepID=A0ABU2ZKC1_9SPHN|nr:tRNA uridine-5-carboxymethylaminomethyl(34) synthesis GTPase MnmE [Croceicoccus sp. F390]MDT0577043.1 tRNA uridine-5-carboxymethylaminomethyl(34) synthesis GTPase MnmE [Croceicoccus sp. F390]
MPETIFAVSSGSPPAAIAVIRISGPAASQLLQTIAGRVPPPRRAVLADLRSEAGDVLDTGMVLYMPGPASATGEDCAELHVHGGRAVVRAVEQALGKIPAVRHAEAGEFTRRAFANGKLDLAQAEGLADLLAAETELQRLNAQAMAGGLFSRMVTQWRKDLLQLSAEVEAVLDFSDEEDAEQMPLDFAARLEVMSNRLQEWLNGPQTETLKEGFRVVLAGPPNSGKSSLFNALVQEDAAIITPVAGTTRDVLQRPVAIDGVPFLFIDTAGLRDDTTDAVELVGIERAYNEVVKADLVLWLGAEGEGPAEAWEIGAKSDLDNFAKKAPDFSVSAVTLAGVRELREALRIVAAAAMPKPGQIALSRFQRTALHASSQEVIAAHEMLGNRSADLLILAEFLRRARVELDRLLGNVSTEDMLDALFGNFCIGK